MKALRSSPFLPVASVLQLAILSCWAVRGLAAASAAAAGAAVCAPATRERAMPAAATSERMFFFMVCFSCDWGCVGVAASGGRPPHGAIGTGREAPAPVCLQSRPRGTGAAP